MAARGHPGFFVNKGVRPPGSHERFVSVGTVDQEDSGLTGSEGS